MVEIHLPASQDDIRQLKAGDEVAVCGRLLTARDMAHKYMVEKRPDDIRQLLDRSIIYHCGPIMNKTGEGWSVVSAGPTTSIREELYQADVIEEYNLAGVIGKGGMGPGTLAACEQYGSVYLQAIGGLAASLAGCVQSVQGVFMLEEFGIPEAMWVFDVVNFPAVVTMDTHGKSLHDEILRQSGINAGALSREA